MLPSKTIPEVKNRKRHALKPKTMKTAASATPPRKKARIASGTEVEDSPHTRRSGGDALRSASISPASSFQVSYPVPVKVRNASYLRNPVSITNIDCEEL
jgi:hypothetical protein